MIGRQIHPGPRWRTLHIWSATRGTASSLICRIASRYGLEAKALRFYWHWRSYQLGHDRGGPRADAEVLLNAAGRQVLTAVCHTYTQAGVQLVLIDEIHRLNPRTTTGAQTADLLKDLTERLPATFVHAGINLPDTPLFTGTRGAQLARRATLITSDPLPARQGTRRPRGWFRCR